jgi:integrative and conjugative element protein (TIGR02256 family)
MAVLRKNDAVAARRQSGITEEGPVGVLIGAGSLGSAMLNLWGRAGWGRWTVIDNDHVKPHNLSRHTAYSQHIGCTKASVVADLHVAAMDGATIVTPLDADATDFSLEAVADALTSTKLVVDASTTLEYPRAVSAVDHFARHFSAFLTPNGNAAVLLAEDSRRLIRLRTLEAQYYRALIQECWGSDHITGNASSFWSGASCRDISMVLPYSRILGQASTLAEQIPAAAAQDGAMIRIWQRDPVSGAVGVHDVLVATEHRIQLDELALFIDANAEQQLRDMRTKGFPNETGGVLLGYYDFNISAVVIVAGLPPPPDSKFSHGSFERGVVGLAEAVAEASRRTAGVVGYIGEWHSHPPGHSASPSRDDLVQLAHLALGMADDGLPAVQLIVGEDDLQILQGAVK